MCCHNAPKKTLKNPLKDQGLPSFVGMADGRISSDPSVPIGLLARCLVADENLLIDSALLAELLGISGLHLKDERSRIGLGSIKALGAAYAFAKLANARAE